MSDNPRKLNDQELNAEQGGAIRPNCGDGYYAYWNGTSYECRPLSTGGGTWNPEQGAPTKGNDNHK